MRPLPYLAVGWTLLLASAAHATEKADQLFGRQVQPLLKAKCQACHGDEPKLRGGLDVRSRADLLKGGKSGAALVPGKATDSLLYQAVLRNGELKMPPKETAKLTAEEIAVLKTWIDAGAPWPKEAAPVTAGNKTLGEVAMTTSGGLTPEWTNRKYQAKDVWAFLPVQKAKVPGKVLERDDQRHPIDTFLRPKLREKGLSFAPSADKRVLIRRLAFDLTGLPPGPEEIEAFVKDDSSDAYDRLVERLLASPQYGERMAQHWLDVVRYADTNGYSLDARRPHAWKYRDYVIACFNDDKPYDRFVIEQIAGDELEPKDPAMKVAVGYLRMGPWEHTGMSVAAVTRQLWLDDVTNSIGVAFLGLGLNCCKCHDHKFDPLPTRDYYRIAAVFGSTGFDDKDLFTVKSQKAQTIRILLGGSLERPADKVDPGVLSAVKGAEVAMPTADAGRRLALARWIASPANPLTARVMANRVWQMHFGKGIVGTPNNFGKMGGKPTHPDLLDWLANWFIENGWSVKKLHRLIATSQAYRQASRHPQPDQVKDADPKGELLAGFRPRRLTAEELRDSMLALTGELQRQAGGPGNFPEINWEVALQPRMLMGNLAKPYEPDPLPKERHRRTIYAFRYRNFSDPILEVFNRPSSETACECRNETTIAPQAFALFNSQFVHDRALALANRLMNMSADPEERLQLAFRLVLGRAPSKREGELSRKHVAEMIEHHQKHAPLVVKPPTVVELEKAEELTGKIEKTRFVLEKMKRFEPDLKPWDAKPETRALAELCLVLLNASEFLYVY
ncbi:hypothetical protein AYO44_01060 [Planctomycetaceae bacterium SCGC AG-212-F19]|nr:hypothetical protein AYO44_01060 [Planctomycetaceae bacterium SCGC AG-212-F19]